MQNATNFSNSKNQHLNASKVSHCIKTVSLCLKSVSKSRFKAKSSLVFVHEKVEYGYTLGTGPMVVLVKALVYGCKFSVW